MAQYRARAKAGWEASAASRPEEDPNNSNRNGDGGMTGTLSAESAQALAEKEGENQVCVGLPSYTYRAIFSSPPIAFTTRLESTFHHCNPSWTETGDVLSMVSRQCCSGSL